VDNARCSRCRSSLLCCSSRCVRAPALLRCMRLTTTRAPAARANLHPGRGGRGAGPEPHAKHRPHDPHALPAVAVHRRVAERGHVQQRKRHFPHQGAWPIRPSPCTALTPCRSSWTACRPSCAPCPHSRTCRQEPTTCVLRSCSHAGAMALKSASSHAGATRGSEAPARGAGCRAEREHGALELHACARTGCQSGMFHSHLCTAVFSAFHQVGWRRQHERR